MSSFRLALGGAALAGLTGLGLSLWPASSTPVPSKVATVKAATVKAATGKAATVAKADPAEAVKRAFTQALIVDRQLGVPSSQEELVLRPSPAGRTDPQAAGRKGVPSVADRQRRIARDRRNISAHFTSAALVARENKTLDSMMNAVADPNARILGAGVSQVDFTSVNVSDHTATIVARSHVWTSSAFRQQAGGNWLDASPEGDKIHNARLSLGPTGTWLVTDMKSGFANGSGP